MKKYEELSGFLSLKPNEQAEFDRLKQIIKNAHLKNGFKTYDAPLMFREDALLAKSGGDTNKQVYRLEKGDAKLAIRFDLTVPLALFVANNERELAFPLKISQINKVYRGEKTQKGRLREFYQCDADVIARGDLPLEYDAECIALADTICSELLTDRADFTIRVANRRLLNGFLESLGLTTENALRVRAVIDDAEKISAADFAKELEKCGTTNEQFQKIKDFIELKGDNQAVLASLSALNITTDEFAAGLAELKTVMQNLALRGVKNAQIDLAIVRGLDYYTGTVFETNISGFENYGSIMSGGRYDNLVANYSDAKFEGVGASIGLSRLYEVLVATKITEIKPSGVDILFVPITNDAKTYEFCFTQATKEQKSGRTTDILFSDRSLSKKLEYAAKSAAKSAAVIGETELASGKYTAKPLR
ncbi:MAG: histidine--tRNA ligase [Candidatus Nomurabacteria bacterium]|jgi:histidyl-tRNA synthetase|nr:histidine--tRNA ligase [Candidatus Nomurabacteria bacterium]